VLSRVAKPLIALIVLLAGPCLGPGGSARAGFVLGQRASSFERPNSSAGFALIVTLDAEEAGAGGAGSGSGNEDRPRDNGNPWLASLPQQLFLAWDGLQAGSAAGGTPTSGPAPGTSGPGLVGMLTPGSPPPPAERADLLFLVDQRFKPPPFALRVFRPPRQSRRTNRPRHVLFLK